MFTYFVSILIGRSTIVSTLVSDAPVSHCELLPKTQCVSFRKKRKNSLFFNLTLYYHVIESFLFLAKNGRIAILCIRFENRVQTACSSCFIMPFVQRFNGGDCELCPSCEQAVKTYGKLCPEFYRYNDLRSLCLSMVLNLVRTI